MNTLWAPLALASLVACSSPSGIASVRLDRQGHEQEQAQTKKMQKDFIVVGGGCFWCTEAIFEELKGVLDVESGYAGGKTKNPTYYDVCTGKTGHAEVVKITYDANVVDPKDLLRIFFTTHDPTTLNRQGPDVGTQYRSAVFVRNEQEKQRVQEVIEEVKKAKIFGSSKIVTTIEPLGENYWVAEEYHQDYFRKFEQATPMQRMQMNAGYCNAIVAPKVLKFRKMYADKLKKQKTGS